jgi:murein DD-endopeptidase MepM/ murein hydrolase activator NlpD
MQKVTQVPSFPEISETVPGVAPQTGGIADIGRERKNNKSAAMIGLAISMGATGVLLPGHNHGVMAATSPAQVAPLNSVSETTEPSQEADRVTEESIKLAPPEIKHTVRQGETIWELSKNYEIAPEKIASSNGLGNKAPLLVGQTVNIPVVEAPAQQPSSQTLTNAPVPLAVQLPVGQSLPVKDNVDQLLQQPQQGQKPLVAASQPNINNTNNSVAIPEGLALRIAIPVVPAGNPTPQQFPKLLPEQHSTLPLNLSSQSSSSVSRIEPPKVIQESGKPIPVPPPQVGRVPMARTPQSGQNSGVIAENNPRPIRLPVQESNGENSPPVNIPLSRVDFQPSSQSRQMATLPQVISRESFPPLVANNSNAVSDRQFYQVRSGDTLNSIARLHGISSGELMQANRITNPDLIKVSQYLVIPSKSATFSQYRDTNSSSRTVSLNVQPNYLGNNNSQVRPVNNTYLNNLRSEISNLRQSPQNQTNNGQGGVNIPVVAQYNSQLFTPVSVNPEWQRNNLPQPPRQANYNNSSFEQPQVIGAVPIPVERYNPMLNPYNGQPVSPDIFSPNKNVPFTGYIWPAKGVLTSGYGWRWGRMHKGVDIAAPVGTPIMASAAGEVVSAGWNSGGYGNLVKLRHSDGSVTLYAHNSRILVRKGQFVEQGQQISEMGSTGFSTGPHLHFEIHPYGQGATNPMAFLPPRN